MYDPEKTIEALVKRDLRVPLTQEETGLVMGVKQGRKTPYTRQYVCNVEEKAMKKLRPVLERAIEKLEGRA